MLIILLLQAVVAVVLVFLVLEWAVAVQAAYVQVL
jgi:hypothetical protein